jgi:hypothetical protein
MRTALLSSLLSQTQAVRPSLSENALTSQKLLSSYHSFLQQQIQPGESSFEDNLSSLLQIGGEIHTDVASGSRPPDETLVDTLTVMKTLLA